MNGFNFRESADRLHRDAEFAAVVDMLYQQIERLGWTPAELREAATMASIKWAERHVEPMFLQDLLSKADSL